jgi:hypothetical protein
MTPPVRTRRRERGVQAEGPVRNIERTDAFRAVKFMPCHRQQIHTRFVDPGRDFSDCLRRVRVERYAVLASDATDFGNRLNRTDFIIRMHNGDKDSLPFDGITHIIRIDPAEAIDRHVSDSGPQAFRENGKDFGLPGARLAW